MSPERSDERWPKRLFLFSLLFLAFSLGVLFQRYQFPPYPWVYEAYRQFRYTPEYLLNDLGIKPTRHLVPAPAPAPNQAAAEPAPAGYEPAIEPLTLTPPEGILLQYRGDNVAVVRNHDPQAMMAGQRLVFGLTPHTDTLFGAMLIDERGRLRHFWPIDYAKIDPDGPSPNNVYIHGTAVFENGDIVTGFDSGEAFARLNSCGDIVWRRDHQHHHAVARSGSGEIATFRLRAPEGRDEIVFYDAASGTPTREPIYVLDDLFSRSEYTGILAIRDTEEGHRGKDPFHFNDLEFLDRAHANAFPSFAAGDMLLSLRELNLVMVIDPDTFELKWWQHGPWHRQHDPDFLPDGTISIYDNRRFQPPSRILRIDPATRQLSTVYEGSETQHFYSALRGKHQSLPNGNVLITESDAGRAFEVTSDGRVVWEFLSRYDEHNVAIVSEAIWLPAGFFEPNQATCGDPVHASD